MASITQELSPPLPAIQPLATLPKVELHVHLEGSVQPATLRDLARNTVPGDRMARWLVDPDGSAVASFADLLELLADVNALLVDPAAYERIAYEHLASLAAQRVVYAELRMNPDRPIRRGLPLGEIVDAIRRARVTAARAFGIESNLIIGLNRNRGPVEAGRLVGRVAALPHEWVAGFDLSDLESEWPPQVFRDVFESIRAAGWPATVHAGELAGAESVAGAIEILGARRIGHGLRALEDPAVVDLIAERDVHLELCPGSNRRLNFIESLSDHPVRHYLDAGLSCSLSTDDPAVFGWGLTEELARDAAVFDLTNEDLLRMAREAVRHSFASDDQKQRVLQRITDASGHESPAVGASQARLDSVLRITHAVTSELQIDDVLQTVARETSRALHADRTTMFVLDDDGAELWSRVGEGLQSEEIRLPIGQGLAGAAAASDQLINVPDVYADDRFDPTWDAKTGYLTRNALAHPLRDRDGQLQGVIQVMNKRGGVFAAADEDLLAAIASAASTALTNAQHYDEVRRLTESALQTMGAMLDARDSDTAGHTLRVAAVADLLADRLGLEAAARAALRIAAAVHDYGKLGTPDALLNKKAPLTLDERVEMERHVILTREILEHFEFPRSLQDVPRIACEHHERYDGSGYPDGHAGQEISLEGRILGMADVIDAMTSDRPYRAAIPLDEVLDYLVAERGRIFDPDIVDACVASQAAIQRLHTEMSPTA